MRFINRLQKNWLNPSLVKWGPQIRHWNETNCSNYLAWLSNVWPKTLSSWTLFPRPWAWSHDCSWWWGSGRFHSGWRSRAPVLTGHSSSCRCYSIEWQRSRPLARPGSRALRHAANLVCTRTRLWAPAAPLPLPPRIGSYLKSWRMTWLEWRGPPSLGCLLIVKANAP